MRPAGLGAFLGLLLLPGPLRAQGALSLLERAALVVEGRLAAAPPRGNPPFRIFRVSRVDKGPSRIRTVPVLALPEISAHAAPEPGRETLLFLLPLPPRRGSRRVFVVLQRPLGALALDLPGGRELAEHVRRLALLEGSPRGKARELLRALCSRSPLAARSAALDLAAHPDLAALLSPREGRVLLSRVEGLGPSCPWAPPLAHVLGILRPPGWDRALAGLLDRPGGEALAGAAGRVLGKRLGEKALALLADSEGREKAPGPARILALGSTGLPKAVPLLRKYLETEGLFPYALEALVRMRSWRAVRVLEEALDGEGPAEDGAGAPGRRAKAVLRALARLGTRPARTVLEDTFQGKRGPALAREAARLLGR